MVAAQLLRKFFLFKQHNKNGFFVLSTFNTKVCNQPKTQTATFTAITEANSYLKDVLCRHNTTDLINLTLAMSYKKFCGSEVQSLCQ
jgi:hypothetical protein